MRSTLNLLFVVCLVLFVLLLALTALANASSANIQPGEVSQIVDKPGSQVPPAVVRAPGAASAYPGNYCVACHVPGDKQLATVMTWRGGIQRESIDPCPAAVQLHQDIYYTERLLLGIERARTNLPQSPNVVDTNSQVAAARQTYSRLLEAPVTSLTAFSTQALQLRYGLGKSFYRLNQVRDSLQKRRALLAGVLVTLVLFISLLWGWRNVSRFGIKAIGPLRPRVRPSLLLLLIFVLFALPIFRTVSQEVAAVSQEQQARQNALDTAGQVANAASQALARSWMLGHIGAAWYTTNAQQAEIALTTALSAADEAQSNDFAMWGEAQSVQEGTVGSQTDQGKARLMAKRLDAINSRAWNLRLTAAAWAGVDQARAEKILQQALSIAHSNNSDIFRDLDTRAIAVTWAASDPAKAMAVADQVQDAGLRAWAFWEIADITGDDKAYDQAIAAARQVADPVARSRSLREIAVGSGRRALFQEALSALDEVQGASLAYALSDLAAASGDAGLVDRIDTAYPDARTAALYRLGQFEPAWTSTREISDPFDRAHAQAVIAAAWGNADAARKIADPTLRDRALKDVAVMTKDVELAQSIESPYYRVQALTALGQYRAAINAADKLSDTYPLRALAIALARPDPKAALALVDKMNNETDKAVALRAIAAATEDPDTFNKALAMALVARVQGDPLVPAEMSLALAQTIQAQNKAEAESAFNQAFEAAQSIMTKYP
jgi:hypothetical protein